MASGNVYANPSAEPPAVNMQYYEQTGRPLMGGPELLTTDELRQRSRSVVRGCCGVFDTAFPNMRQFGRTYNEVISYAASGEFVIFSPPVLRWVQSEAYGVRPIAFVQWVEIATATKDTIRRSLLPSRFASGVRNR